MMFPQAGRRRHVNGVVLLDKPEGIGSNQALQRIRRLYRAEKAGHIGTLDPLATGVLPICFGEATKFGAAGMEADKVYRFQIRLGVTTTTGDREGTVLECRPVVGIDEQAVRAALPALVGAIQQVPPVYSAIKIDGRPAYAHAREGNVPEMSARTVHVHGLELLAFAGENLTLRAHVGKGTYVRALATDLGLALGCGAHVVELRREAVGCHDLGQTVTLTALESMTEAERDALLEPVDFLLDGMASIEVATHDAERLAQGQAVAVDANSAGRLKVYGAGRFLGLADAEEGRLKPRRWCAAPSPSTTPGYPPAPAGRRIAPSS
ncbi:MAG: tRNA pseudouridine(55) synthase TruB [Rhodocyclaceae bacterium]|nr:tRNA pseudouridine(55) synthase TruB [Rhodocyclaceae bacterium]